MVDFFQEFTPSLNLLAKFGYQQSVQFFPALYGNFFEVSNKLPTNPVVHELKLMGFARASAYIDEFRPDAVISTFPVAGGVVSDIKASRPLVSATIITDFGVHRAWLHPATDFYFVACQEVREDLVVRGIPWERVVVSGIPVAEKFSQEFERTALRRELGSCRPVHRAADLGLRTAGRCPRHREEARGLGNPGGGRDRQQRAAEAPSGLACQEAGSGEGLRLHLGDAQDDARGRRAWSARPAG